MKERKIFIVVNLRTARRSNQSIPKEISPGISLEKKKSWNSSTLATSCEELTHWKRLWCWEGLGTRGEGDDWGWDGWMASLTQWTRVWVNSGSWWWTGSLVGCDSWGRKESDMTERLNWTDKQRRPISPSICLTVWVSTNSC